jgi:hypothetical protein
MVNADLPASSATGGGRDRTERPDPLERGVAFLKDRFRSRYLPVLALIALILVPAAKIYSPSILIPVAGQINRFQIYVFDNGYTEPNSDFYPARTVQEVARTTTQIRFPAHDRFRLDFLKSGTVKFLGVLYKREHSGLSVTTTTYALDPSRLFTHGMLLQPDGTYVFDINDDPYVDIPLSALALTTVNTAWSFVPVGLFIALPALIIWIYRMRGEFTAHTPFFLSVLCLGMFVSFLALTLPFNHGPDEIAHVLAGKWYLDHLLPPSMADPIFYDAYWGWDYLIGGPDLTYWLSFKAASLIDALTTVDLYISARFAQIVLCLLCALAIIRFAAADIAWAFLLSLAVVPQLAYSLTYFNGDALSYCLSFAALAVLWRPRPGTSLAAVVICLFVMCNMKLNYIALLPVGLYCIYLNYGFRAWPWAALGLATGSYKRIFDMIDEHLVGRTFLQNELLHASPAAKHQLVTTDWSHLFGWQFYISSLKSLYGVFGYMTWFLPWYYYAIAVSLAFVLLKANSWRQNGVIAACFLVSFAASQYFTATVGYQAQGRYLFPAVVALFLFTSRNITAWKYFWYAIPAAMALGGFWAATSFQPA